MNSARPERAERGSPGSRPERGGSPDFPAEAEPNESCAPSSPEGSRPSGADGSRAAAGGSFPLQATGRLEVVERTHALIAWILPTVARFPRAHRYSLGSRIEGRVYGVLERLVRAAFLDRSRKGAALDDANIEVEVLRHEFRIAFSLRLVSAGQVEHATRMLDEVGRQIGGWRRSVR
jgi:hypothetical protein